MMTHRGRGGAIATIVLGFLLQTIHAFENEGWNFDEDVSVSNPRSYGAIDPLLFGKPAKVTIRFGELRGSWSSLSGDRGAYQLWGQPLQLSDVDASASELDQAIRQFITQNSDLFRVSSQELVWSKARTKFWGPYRFITYERRVREMLIDRAYITFRLVSGHLVQVSNYSFGDLPLMEEPAVSEDEAVMQAMEDSQFVEGVDRVTSKVIPKVQPFLDPRGQLQFRVVYKVSIKRKKPKAYWHYSVSAATGNIVEVKNGLHSISGEVRGEVYARKPGDELRSIPLSDLHVFVGDHVMTTNAEGQYSSDLDAPQAFARIKGTRVSVRRNNERSSPGKAGVPDEVIQFTAKENISELMAFYHLTRVNQFVSRFISGDFLKKPVEAITELQDPRMKSCNAWFDPEEVSLNFLPGDDKCNPTSHVADVMYHEWGHYLDHQLGGIQDSAFSEGIGDITSYIMTNDPALAPGFFKENDRPLRTIEGQKLFPRDRNRDPHKEGLIIGNAWYATSKKFQEKYGESEGRMKMANLFFKHLVTTESYLDSYHGAIVLDDDNANLSDCTPNMCLLNKVFAERGLTAKDARCVTEKQACAETTVFE